MCRAVDDNVFLFVCDICGIVTNFNKFNEDIRFGRNCHLQTK
jgi:hypothetical protein